LPFFSVAGEFRSVTGTASASSEGEAIVIAERERARRKTTILSNYAFNDNELEDILPTLLEVLYLRRGLPQAGGKLPLFDLDGQAVDSRLVRHCLAQGWAEPWFNNPLKPDWLVCKLTEQGRRIVEAP
jgi:hypothetical protein